MLYFPQYAVPAKKADLWKMTTEWEYFEIALIENLYVPILQWYSSVMLESFSDTAQTRTENIAEYEMRI